MKYLDVPVGMVLPRLTPADRSLFKQLVFACLGGLDISVAVCTSCCVNLSYYELSFVQINHVSCSVTRVAGRHLL